MEFEEKNDEKHVNPGPKNDEEHINPSPKNDERSVGLMFEEVSRSRTFSDMIEKREVIGDGGGGIVSEWRVEKSEV